MDMKQVNWLLIGCLMAFVLFSGCKKDDDQDDGNVVMYYFFTGNVNGSPVCWQVDNVAYKMSMAPYNSNNVSPNNNYVRYGTSIWTNNASQTPFICVEFSGFNGNGNDAISTQHFIDYFHTGVYPFSNATNQDTALGVNIVYEADADYTTIHESAQTLQPGSSSFSVDSLQIVQETNKTTKAYVRISFDVVLKDITGSADIEISEGVLRVLVDNYLEE